MSSGWGVETPTAAPPAARSPRSWSACPKEKGPRFRKPWARYEGTNEAGLAGLVLRGVLRAHLLAQRLALGGAELAVAVRVVLLQHLGAPRLALLLHGLALLGVDGAVVVRVELREHLCLA